MSWNALTADDVLNGLSPQEAATMQNIAGDKSVTYVNQAIAKARGSILAGGNQLGPDGTVPDQLQTEVIDIARWRWLIAFPQLAKLQTKERKDAHDEAVKLLRDVAKGEPKVEVPAAPANLPAPVNAVSVPRAGRRICSRSFDKLGET